MAKKNKSFLPKRIAGVKVPKKVRKGRFGEFLASAAGQAALAAAVRQYDVESGAPGPSAEGWTKPAAPGEASWPELNAGHQTPPAP